MATENKTKIDEKSKIFDDDSNLQFLSSNGFKYLKDIENDKETTNLSVSAITKEKERSQTEISTVKKQAADVKEDNDENKMLEIFGTLKINNDITFGLGPLEFEAGIEESDVKKYRTMRLRCHASYVYACAHAAYFIAVANKFK